MEIPEVGEIVYVPTTKEGVVTLQDKDFALVKVLSELVHELKRLNL